MTAVDAEPIVTQQSDRRRLAESADTLERASSLAGPRFAEWFAVRCSALTANVRYLPLDGLDSWSFSPITGNLSHDSGRFFSVTGMHVMSADAPEGSWQQPVIDQPESGILGILVKEFDGVLHCLMQAKVEPGSVHGLQLSPTVQATRSNYTKVHRGNSVRYLDYFVAGHRSRVLFDVLQSEHGSWFYRKRNHNMVVEATEEVEVHDDYHWVTLGQLRQLLLVEDLVHMDARTVLANAPLEPIAAEPGGSAASADLIAGALRRSLQPSNAAGGLRAWLADQRSHSTMSAGLVSLDGLADWTFENGVLRHCAERYFSIVGVRVDARSREVSHWCQPLLRPSGMAVIAFIAAQLDGVLHVLVKATAEPGLVDHVEIGPTVACTLANYASRPSSSWPPFLTTVLNAAPSEVVYDRVHSEEGGRFDQALGRHMLVMSEPFSSPAGFRWTTLAELSSLLAEPGTVTIQARSLLACVHAAW